MHILHPPVTEGNRETSSFILTLQTSPLTPSIADHSLPGTPEPEKTPLALESPCRTCCVLPHHLAGSPEPGTSPTSLGRTYSQILPGDQKLLKTPGPWQRGWQSRMWPGPRAVGWLFDKRQQGWTSIPPILTAGSAVSPVGRAGSPLSPLQKLKKEPKGFGLH